MLASFCFADGFPRRKYFSFILGGPIWAGKDIGSWSIPKGIVEPEEDELAGARREFHEETGFDIELEKARDLGVFPLSSSKTLRVWAVEGDCDPRNLLSNSFEWSGRPSRAASGSFLRSIGVNGSIR